MVILLCWSTVSCVLVLKTKRGTSVLKEQIKAAAIQAKTRNSSGVGGQRPKAPSNMEGNTKKAKEAKEASKKVRQAPIATDTYLEGLMSCDIYLVIFQQKQILPGSAQCSRFLRLFLRLFTHSGSRHCDNKPEKDTYLRWRGLLTRQAES